MRAVLVLALAATGCGLLPAAEGPEAPPAPAPEAPAAAEPTAAADAGDGFVTAPALGVRDWVKGEPVDLASEDQVVLVEHWATWCGPCRVEMPHLTELQAEHRNQLVVVGISDEPTPTVEPFVRRNAHLMEYTVAAAPPSALSAWTTLSGADSIPYSYLVKGGQILWHGHPAGLGGVLPRVLDGSWTVALAKAYAELPTIPAAYVSALDLAGIDAARAAAQPLLDSPGFGADVKNELSWGILTEIPEDKRDLDLAVALAEQATAELNHESWAQEDTLGLAYYLNGQVPQAIEAQSRAVELCEAAQAGLPCAELKDRLGRFERGEAAMD